MNRRRFLATAAMGVGALSGCGSVPFIGGGGSAVAPPRASKIVSDVKVTEQAITVDLVGDAWVQSRQDFGNSNAVQPASLGLVGRAQAKGKGKGSKGATGRGKSRGWSKAPSARKSSRRKYYGGHGNDYDDWEDKHGDEVRKVDTVITTVGVAQVASITAEEDDLPNPGPVDWDKEITDPSGTIDYGNVDQGWYRVGAKVAPENGSGSFDVPWESIDFQVLETSNGYEKENPWKVSPRL